MPCTCTGQHLLRARSWTQPAALKTMVMDLGFLWTAVRNEVQIVASKTGRGTRRLHPPFFVTVPEPILDPLIVRRALHQDYWVMNVTSAQCSGMMSTRRIVTRAAKLLSRSYGQPAVTVSCGSACVSQIPRSQVLPLTQSRSKTPLSLTRTWASLADTMAVDDQTGGSRGYIIHPGQTTT